MLNTHILHLTFALVGTVDSDRESSVIPNRVAFKDLLCDLEVSRQNCNVVTSLEKGIVQRTMSRYSKPHVCCKVQNYLQIERNLKKIVYQGKTILER